jgi:hypothetical protein
MLVLILGQVAAVAALVLLAALILRALVVRWFEAFLAGDPRAGPVELLYALPSFRLRGLALTAQRAATAAPALVPMEPPLVRRWLDEIRFDPATLGPRAGRRRPRLDVRLGPRARRPLRLAFPLILAGMGWGVGLSAKTRRVLAEAAAATGLALSSGEGPVLAFEPALGGLWIWQWSRANWRGQGAAAWLADMVELQVGQASEGGVGLVRLPQELPRAVRRFRAGRPLVIRAGFPLPLPAWIRAARRRSGGAPVAVKVPASDHVERDVLLLARLGADVIVLDGAGAGTSGSPAVLADHQGIPVAVAIRRAHRALTAAGLRADVSLVGSGHLHSAADVAKLLALGADAAAVGVAALLAMTQGQLAAVLPERAPTALVFARPRGRPHRLDEERAKGNLTRWLLATRAELEEILRSLGLVDIRQLAAEHLVAETRETAALLCLRWYGRAPRPPAPAEWRRLIRTYLETWEEGMTVWRTLLGDLLALRAGGTPPSRVRGRGPVRRPARGERRW